MGNATALAGNHEWNPVTFGAGALSAIFGWQALGGNGRCECFFSLEGPAVNQELLSVLDRQLERCAGRDPVTGGSTLGHLLWFVVGLAAGAISLFALLGAKAWRASVQEATTDTPRVRETPRRIPAKALPPSSSEVVVESNKIPRLTIAEEEVTLPVTPAQIRAASHQSWRPQR